MTLVIHCQREGATIEREHINETYCPNCGRTYGDGHNETCCFHVTEKVDVRALPEGDADIQKVFASS